ncbi:MAG: right-handed parallel beta-helix repeat-containing protein [Promethearchaeota archaeon]
MIKTKSDKFSSKKIIRIFVLTVCIIFTVSLLSLNATFIESFNNFPTKELNEEKLEHVPLTSAYTLVDPINITLAGDWGSYPFITGNGSEINPYIIENIEIQGNGVKTMEKDSHTYLKYNYTGIYIAASGKFIIRNCKITSFSVGIYLDLGISGTYNHSIQGVEIDNCGMGIYNGWAYFVLNISKCNISNCNWVTIKAPYFFDNPLLYGGYGIWARADGGSTIESCLVQNCSIGVYCGKWISPINNELINCGMLFDFDSILTYTIGYNTINGKPLGLFITQDNLTISGTEASQYGQLIFAGCNNLRLLNIHIEDACSFGLIIDYCYNSNLQNIVCENQKIGFFINSPHITANNLHAKSCDAGFFLRRIGDSTLTRLLTDDTNIPYYVFTLNLNATIGIEKSTRFIILDQWHLGEIQINSSVSSFNVLQSNISEFEFEGFEFQLNNTDIYYVNDLDPIHEYLNLIIIVFDRYQTSVIPGFPLFWLFTAMLLGILFVKFSFRRKKRKVTKFHLN